MEYHEVTVEIELADQPEWMVATVAVEAVEEDASYSHEFGVKQEAELNIKHVEVEEVLDEDGGVLIVDNDTIETIKERAKAKVIEDWQGGEL